MQRRWDPRTEKSEPSCVVAVLTQQLLGTCGTVVPSPRPSRKRRTRSKARGSHTCSPFPEKLCIRDDDPKKHWYPPGQPFTVFCVLQNISLQDQNYFNGKVFLNQFNLLYWCIRVTVYSIFVTYCENRPLNYLNIYFYTVTGLPVIFLHAVGTVKL